MLELWNDHGNGARKPLSSVQSISRAFAVLDALRDGPHGVTEVAERASLPKSTAARLLASLAAEDAVEQLPGDRRWRLSGRVVTLAAAIRPTRSLIALARPHLAGLAAQTGEAAGLAVPDGHLVHYIDQVDTTQAVGVRDWTGTRLPMHAVSSGHVFLAHLPAAELERFLATPLPPFTERTIVEPQALRARLGEVQRDGVAWTVEEFALGLASVAAPVVDDTGEVVAAVHVHGPAYRFPGPDGADEVVEALVAATRRISAGGRGR
jgi:DNA-binding IclR family transcriptional regulator